MAAVGFDYGHGGNDPGATYNGRKEADDVLRVGMKTAKVMRDHGVTVDETRTSDKTLSLQQRSSFLNKKKYDFVVSFHRNSAKAVATGVETFAHPQSNSKSKALSKRMNDELVKIGFVNRGAKTANFHMVREVKAYSVLPEIGFINNPKDNKLFDDNIDKIAEAIAKSLLAEMGIKFKGVSSNPSISKPSVSGSIYYGVDSPHNTKSGVMKLQQDLVSLGHSVGSYGANGVMGKDTRDAIIEFQTKHKIKIDGFAGQGTLALIAKLIAEKNKPKPKPVVKPSPKPVDTNIAITGNSVATAKQMEKALLTNNKNPKIKITALEFCKLFLEEGKAEGIRGDIAFCQAMKETGWLSYGGQVLPEQHNYSGLGATNNSPTGKGNWFESERIGIRAQIQHLKAYANKESLVNPLVDQRFKYVTRGIAPNWIDLNGRWAVPGTTYGQDILKMYIDLINIIVENDKVDGDIVDKAEMNKLKEELAKAQAIISKIQGIVN